MELKRKIKKRGVTLIELLIAMGIFLCILVAITSILIQLVKAQRKYFAIQDVQENVRHIMETMSKEIRMSELNACSNDASGFSLSMTAYNEENPDGLAVNYIADNESSSDPSEISRNGQPITSSKVWLVGGTPYCSISEVHRRATFVIPLNHRYISDTSIKIQNTVSSRVY
ncbi:MAG: prepilin-type N-terminal cleavage/methylation domain-containing protein [Candidatus Portnoybacteria bacterium]|nr:prepilin-type N-terminal cleavage/methylation domain-containing protein [Candidatus Portnoybacteria bacterium]